MYEDDPGTRAIVELDAQHEALRGMMDRCLELADAMDAGGCGPTELLHEVERLRLAFDAHNRFEEALLRPMLNARVSQARAQSIEHTHLAEHRSLRIQLAADVGTPATRDLRTVIEGLRAHLDHEEDMLLATHRIAPIEPPI